MLLIGFTGIFSVTALRKIFIIDYKLAYPSGTATGVLINSLHTPVGEKRVSDLLATAFFSLFFFFSSFFSVFVFLFFLVSVFTVPVCKASERNHDSCSSVLALHFAHFNLWKFSDFSHTHKAAQLL